MRAFPHNLNNMGFAYLLAEILEKGIEKNGNKPLTTLHLLNIVKLCIKIEGQRCYKNEKLMDEAYMEIYADQCGDRD